MHRVQKLIAEAGICSRRAAEELIKEGKVKVNKKRITIGTKADKEKDIIQVEGKTLRFPKKRYVIFHKPTGYTTTCSDPKEKRTIFQLIKSNDRLYPIGRLDKYTSGLLLLTNDGDFANKIMHPRYEIKKTYLVEIDKPLRSKDKKQIEKGVVVEGQKTAQAKVLVLDNKSIELTIHEGRNRIVRKILAELDYKVVKLHRTAIGMLELGQLKEGRSRELKPGELTVLTRETNHKVLRKGKQRRERKERTPEKRLERKSKSTEKRSGKKQSRKEDRKRDRREEKTKSRFSRERKDKKQDSRKRKEESSFSKNKKFNTRNNTTKSYTKKRYTQKERRTNKKEDQYKKRDTRSKKEFSKSSPSFTTKQNTGEASFSEFRKNNKGKPKVKKNRARDRKKDKKKGSKTAEKPQKPMKKSFKRPRVKKTSTKKK